MKPPVDAPKRPRGRPRLPPKPKPEPLPKRGRPHHQPTDKTKGIVLGCVSAGLRQDLIARQLGISEDTLQRHYRHELDSGIHIANANVAQALYRKAISPGLSSPSITAAIWWDKTRNGMKEAVRNEFTGADGGPMEVLAITDEARARALAAFIAKTSAKAGK